MLVSSSNQVSEASVGCFEGRAAVRPPLPKVAQAASNCFSPKGADASGFGAGGGAAQGAVYGEERQVVLRCAKCGNR